MHKCINAFSPLQKALAEKKNLEMGSKQDYLTITEKT